MRVEISHPDKSYNKMNQDQLESVVDNLQTFVQLKMQNLLIYSWIQIKKTFGCTSLSSHLRTRSYSHTYKHINHYAPNKQPEILIQPPTSTQDLNLVATERYSNQFESINRNDELFQTFNQFKGFNKLSVHESDTYQYDPSHNINFKTNYQDAEEGDQFEQIVLDRLSKLQENINKLMAEKRIKQQWRGFVGGSLEYKQQQYKSNHYPSNESMDEESADQNQLQEDDPKQPYEFWQASPVKAGREDIIYNLKYIPMIKKDPVNIYKIRELIDSTHREDQNQSLGNGQDLNGEQNKPTQLQMDHRKRAKVYLADQKSGKPSKQKGSSTLYFNRYQGKRSIHDGDQVHFAPKNLEMQTVIQSRGKYFRNNVNKNIHIRNRDANIRFQRKALLNGKISAASNSSSNSYFSSRSDAANNRSSLY